MQIEKTVLIVPPNDAEAVMIILLAEKLGLDIIKSNQPHGASVDKIEGLVEQIQEGGWQCAVIIEMPGLKTEEALRKLGLEVIIIDHHHYTNLNRAHNPETGEQLPSSLEQFLKLFVITDAQLETWGFEPRLVRAIGVMDRGYAWSMLLEGYGWPEIEKTFKYYDYLMGLYKNMDDEKAKLAYAKKLWDKRVEWNGYFIVEDDSEMSMRRRVSRIIALEMKKPTPLIMIEKGRGFIYVQESDKAMDLFERFGGFTFGLHHNWGYKNEPGKPKIDKNQVLQVLS